MIKIEKVEVTGFETAIRGMRNPMNSWDKMDSHPCLSRYNDDCDCPMVDCGDEPAIDCSEIFEKVDYCIGENDYDLMNRLSCAGSCHAKYRRMIIVSCDITAPLYWWKEFDTYKVGTVSNSCSTMHKIQAKEFTLDDFSHEHLELNYNMALLDNIIHCLNVNREQFNETKDKQYWWQMIQLLPNSYNQKRTVLMNYEVLSNMYKWRYNHKLDEWCKFCTWIESLPYSRLITGKRG